MAANEKNISHVRKCWNSCQMWFDELTNLDSGQVLLTYEFDIHVCLKATVDSPTFTPLSQPFLMNLCCFFRNLNICICFIVLCVCVWCVEYCFVFIGKGLICFASGRGSCVWLFKIQYLELNIFVVVVIVVFIVVGDVFSWFFFAWTCCCLVGVCFIL